MRTRLSAFVRIFATLTLVSAGSALAESSTETAPRPDASADASTQPSQAPAAGAPAADPNAKQKERFKGVEEITVTARRQEESIQQAPVTVTAFDSEDLEENDIRSLEDVAQFVPNLQFDQAAGSSNASRIYLRGVGNGDTIISDDNGVGIYVDNVFLPRAAGTLLTVSDVERIEVLSGPQGTLYGKNTIGGLVNYITKKPQWQREGRANVRIGTNGTLDTGFVWNEPLVSERAALRVSLATRHNDGFVKDSFRDRDTQDTRSLNGRVQLLLQATDDLEFLLSYAQSRSREHGYTGKCKLNNTNVGGLNQLLFPTFAQECADDEQRRDVRRVSRDGSLQDDLDTVNSYFQANWSPTDWLTIKSNTAFNLNKPDGAGDFDGTSLPIFNGAPSDVDNGKQRSIAQEVTFSGKFPLIGREVTWIGGGFYLREKNFDNSFTTDRPSTVTEVGGTPFTDVNVLAGLDPLTPAASATRLGFLTLSNGFGPCKGAATTIPDPTAADGIARGNPTVVNGVTVPGRVLMGCKRDFEGLQTSARLKSNVLSYAGFGSFDVPLSEKLGLTVGARLTMEQREVDRFRIVNENDRTRLVTPIFRPSIRVDGIVTDFHSTIRAVKWTPSASLTYLFTDAITGYVSYAKGFKSGGFNGRVEGDGNERVSYDPENLENYELGLKTSWFERRLIVNASYFRSRYKDIQLPNLQLTSGARLALVVDNAGEALINGLDLQITARPPIQGLTLRGTLGITNARYRTFRLVPGGPNQDVPLIGTPTYSFNISAVHALDVGRLGTLSSRLSWSFTGDKSSDTIDFDSTHVDKVGTLGAGLTLALPDGKTSISLNGSNLLNRTYFLTGIELGATTQRFFAPPRQIGLEVRRQF
jgi:iron complex outermembrane receptor protein